MKSAIRTVEWFSKAHAFLCLGTTYYGQSAAPREIGAILADLAWRAANRGRSRLSAGYGERSYGTTTT